MATFSTNQVKQLYVATSVKTPHVLPTDAAGAIAVKSNTEKSHLYFEYKGADNLMRSDLIDVKKILYAKATDTKNMVTNLKSFTVALDSNVNEGNPVVGQEYILRITIRGFVGLSPEDTYFKFGMVHAYSGMTADTFYKILAQSVAMNFSRDVVPLVKVEVHSKATTSKGGFDSNGYMVVTPSTKDNGKNDTTNPYYDGTSAVVTDIDSIRITEVEQPWRLGVMEQVPVYYEVNTDTIKFNGDDVLWGTITEGVNGTIGNGKKIADLEYFCMGERGDIYRGIGFPHNIVTTYLVDPSKEYYTFDIHYAYVGDGVSVQKSEKDIVIVCADKTEFNKIITNFNSATGLNVSTIS